MAAICVSRKIIPTAGDFIDLRFEMNALVVLSTCQHPLDPARTGISQKTLILPPGIRVRHGG